MELDAEFDTERSATFRTLKLLDTIAASPGATLASIAGSCGLPRSSAHRLVAPLVAQRYVVILGRGRYFVGPRALALGRRTTLRDLLTALARPFVADLSRRCRAHAHLGLFEGGMVTYAVKRSFGRNRLFSREGSQLEAYCSAVGKALLAQLDAPSLEHYLAQDTFVALTPHTITDPEALRAEIAMVRERGWAGEYGEIMPGLGCVAVPVAFGGGSEFAALSLSFHGDAAAPARMSRHIAAMRNIARVIAEKLGSGEPVPLNKPYISIAPSS